MIAIILVVLILCGSGHGDHCNKLHNLRYNLCCNNSITQEQYDCLYKLHDELIELFKEETTRTFREITNQCPALCVFNESDVKKILKLDMKLDGLAIMVMLSAQWGKEWKSVIPKIASKCKKQIDEIFRGSYEIPSGRCYSANMLVECLTIEVVSQCPTSSWMESTLCNELRFYIDNCPINMKY